MSTSLRDQLLKAGLVSEKQVKQAEKHDRKQPRAVSAAADAQKRAAAHQAQAAKAARDKALNRQNAAKAEAKAREAQVRQIIEQHRLPGAESGTPYYFQDGAQIKRIDVDANQRRKLIAGEVVIARLGSGFALLPPAAAARVRERDSQAIVDLDADVARSDRDEADAYKGFEVPDDLIW